MITDNAYPAVTFQNQLTGISLVIYDSFSTTDATDASKNYFGTLTQVSSLQPGAEQTIQPLHGPVSAYIAFDTSGQPVGRYVTMGFDVATINITQQDVDAMKNTNAFLDFILNDPNDPLTTSFKAILSKESLSPADIDDFFSKTTAYANCTFQTYMLAATTRARAAASTSQPVDKKTYSLSLLCNYLGGTWPSAFPDIEVSNFSCDTSKGWVTLSADVDLRNMPFENDIVLGNVLKLLPASTVTVQLFFNYNPGLSIGFTRLRILFDNYSIATGTDTTININNPSVTLDINPLFKFVVFTVAGTIPFSVFNTNFNADLTLTVDNEEANIGVVIEGNNMSLPAPPVLKGLHFDSFGVGMGLFFKPPGFAIGVQGKYHIGNADGSNIIAVDDDTFVIVCVIEDEIPNPVYASFYVPTMSINQVIELFTNSTVNIDVPVTFTDLSFKWAENPMEPIVLPDGTLSDMSAGFSAAVNIFSFGFYGDVEIDLTNGLTADLEAAPLSLGSLFQLSGDGKGVTIKVDQNGNPIKNNQIPTTADQQKILATATNKQLVSPGGPVLSIRTLESPILHVNAKVSLFDLVNYAITADVGSNGISFTLNYGLVLTTQMQCMLDNFHNLYASYGFGINRTISLGIIGGVSLGTIPLVATVNAHLSITTSLSDIVLAVGGSFDFEGLTRSFGDFNADIHIQKITNLIEAAINNIEQEASAIFHDLTGDAQVWANKVKQGLIRGVNSVSTVLCNAFQKTAPEVASIMKQAGYAASDIASDIKNTFSIGANDVAAALKAAGYNANEVVSALGNIFNLADIASALNSVFGMAPNDIKNLFEQAGYAASDIGNAFKSLGGDFEKAGQAILKGLNPSNW